MPLLSASPGDERGGELAFGCEEIFILPSPPSTPGVIEQVPTSSEVDDAGRVLTFRVVGKNGCLLRRVMRGSAGYGLCSSEDEVISCGHVDIVDTGVVVCMPRDYYGRVAPRSSLAKRCIDIGGGIIDSDLIGAILECGLQLWL